MPHSIAGQQEKKFWDKIFKIFVFYLDYFVDMVTNLLLSLLFFFLLIHNCYIL